MVLHSRRCGGRAGGSVNLFIDGLCAQTNPEELPHSNREPNVNNLISLILMSMNHGQELWGTELKYESEIVIVMFFLGLFVLDESFDFGKTDSNNDFTIVLGYFLFYSTDV